MDKEIVYRPLVLIIDDVHETDRQTSSPTVNGNLDETCKNNKESRIRLASCFCDDNNLEMGIM